MGADQNVSYDDFEQFDSSDMPVKRVFEAYRYKAARSAVLAPFYSYAFRKDVVHATSCLRNLWRDRLTHLSTHGWYALRGNKYLQYMRNCPPVGFLLPRKTRCCTKPNVCPFCWGRQRVLEPFRDFETVLYGATGKYVGADGHLLPLVRPDLKIVWFVARTDGSADVAKPLTPETMGCHWDHVRGNMNRKRDYEVRGFDAEFGSVVVKVFPIPAENRLGLVRSGVLLVPEGDLPDLTTRIKYAQGGGRMEILDPSKKNLFRAAKRGLAFPSRMLRADPRLTAALLNRMRDTKTQTWYGGKPKSTIEE